MIEETAKIEAPAENETLVRREWSTPKLSIVETDSAAGAINVGADIGIYS